MFLRGRRTRIALSLAALCLSAAAFAQWRGRIWAQYEDEMQDPVEDPPDPTRPAEFRLGRLRYRSPLDRRRSRYFRWGIDANKGDRLFIAILSRLTRIDAQPIETIVDIDSDDMFDHPWLFAVSVGDWQLSATQAERLRKYLDRGGSMLVDDFHNQTEWEIFMTGIRQIYPSANVVDLAGSDAPFHTLFDMTERVRVPGQNVVHDSGIERGGVTPAWRALLDSRGRMSVAICFNMDVGDGWEFADDPYYPERYASEAMRLGANYVVYAMTH